MVLHLNIRYQNEARAKIELLRSQEAAVYNSKIVPGDLYLESGNYDFADLETDNADGESLSPEEVASKQLWELWSLDPAIMALKDPIIGLQKVHQKLRNFIVDSEYDRGSYVCIQAI